MGRRSEGLVSGLQVSDNEDKGLRPCAEGEILMQVKDYRYGSGYGHRSG